MTAPLLTTDLPLPGKRAGKVRDVYPCRLRDGREAVLLVATDRISAFDVVMPNAVPGKGAVLTGMSAFWFARITERFGDTLPHHLLGTDPELVEGLRSDDVALLRGRVMIGRAAAVVPIECVVRGYLAGSGWSSYQREGGVCGVELPAGLKRAERLAEPVFTPTTKAAAGHDEPITFERACDEVGGDLMHALRDRALKLYRMGHDHAAQRGVILADTKFEFGVPLERGAKDPMLIDEVMTPDSSRYWPADRYEPGHEPPSFDKQFVRDHLQRLTDAGGWNQQPPGPTLPDEVIRHTAERYHEALRRITGPPRE
jgi:phosphoribosylaminoimidazole-succinocarboxamide synthase